MKKIIAVRGTINAGKTTSIKMALDLLKKKPSAKLTIIKDGTDVIVIVEINGVIIIVASAGDTEEILKEMLSKISSINWDILICATKTRGKTVMLIENCNPKHSTIWIDKNPAPSNQIAANEATAHEILGHTGI